MDDDRPTGSSPERDRLDRLSRRDAETYAYNPFYSKLIRKLRVLLPVLAAIMVTITFVWTNTKKEDIVAADKTKAPVSVGKNELVSPKFESTDDKGEPYKITAERASQDEQNEKLIHLTRPFADILLNEGNWVALQGDTGEFAQDEKQLLLHGHVRIFHDKGYQLTTEQLHIDMAAKMAETDTLVTVTGPAGTLDAKGLRAYSETGTLIFNGPAKLVLLQTEGSKGLEGMAPK